MLAIVSFGDLWVNKASVNILTLKINLKHRCNYTDSQSWALAVFSVRKIVFNSKAQVPISENSFFCERTTKTICFL